MRCHEYIGTQWYKDDRRLTDKRGKLPSLVHFGDRLCDEFEAMGVPLRVDYPDTDSYSLVVEHCILGDDLPELCWLMIATKAAWLAQSDGCDFRWSNQSPGQIELDNLVVGIGFTPVKYDDDGWPVITDPRWRRVNHKWLFVDDPDAVTIHY